MFTEESDYYFACKSCISNFGIESIIDGEKKMRGFHTWVDDWKANNPECFQGAREEAHRLGFEFK